MKMLPFALKNLRFNENHSIIMSQVSKNHSELCRSLSKRSEAIRGSQLFKCQMVNFLCDTECFSPSTLPLFRRITMSILAGHRHDAESSV